MHSTRRAALLGAAILTLAAASACTSSAPSAAESAASSRATAAPGTYGTDIDPSVPDPTDVATDAPVRTGHTDSGTLLVTYADWNGDAQSAEVDSYLPGVVEDAGTCTLTLTKGSASASVSLAGFPDASSTSCSGLAVPADQLSPGTWSAVVTYTSKTSSASSQPTDVHVP